MSKAPRRRITGAALCCAAICFVRISSQGAAIQLDSQSLGLYAPLRVSGNVGVVVAANDELPRFVPAVEQQIIVKRLALWSDLHPFAESVLSRQSCEHASAVAHLALSIQGEEGQPRPFSVSAKLYDCAGWPVTSWSVQSDEPPTPVNLRKSILALLDRMHFWMVVDAERAALLFDRGLAYDRRYPLGEMYRLSRRPDGTIRLLVRAGGPAWQKGLRSGDLIETIDGVAGDLFGTATAEQALQDPGLHTLTVKRGAQRLSIAIP